MAWALDECRADNQAEDRNGVLRQGGKLILSENQS